ncbi:MAG TPA: UDP-3-O-acyl-N-acetylglucosamine deacetylase [Rhodospirillales bacterium]|nr:UDP-3-O-acyl-N-acetylglucosamine deacetylase [Rhodospirillales bacterium]
MVNGLDHLDTLNQRTLISPVACDGIGLHTAAAVAMTLSPADAGVGITFKRTDIARSAPIAARWDQVVDTRLCTTLGNDDGNTVSTVEHLMAAFSGCGVDNVVVEVDGPELPIMDGSSAPFVSMIESVGLVEQPAPLRIIRLHKTVTVSDGERFASLAPGDGFTLAFEISFENPAVARQTIMVGLVNGTFKRELASARTFGFLDDVEAMQAAGLARGGSLDNAVVISGDSILNVDGLRYEDEFVRHKALDAIGDLFLAGARITGRFEGVCSGHDMNNRLLRAMFADAEAWSLVTVGADEAEAASQVVGEPVWTAESDQPRVAFTA